MAETKDDNWSKEIVQILASKDGQEHPPKTSASASVRMALARSHRISLDDGLLYLDLHKQDPERHKDEPRQLYIPTPLRNRILREAHDTAVPGQFGAAKIYDGETTVFLARDVERSSSIHKRL
jgi:hypothetical protein